ncbi:MAG TPA: hypothetical protein VHT27_01840 [Solirubrobacteraceae bacterium]|nr:hypothetical protein [Solirubrobacteraceae bacterium]
MAGPSSHGVGESRAQGRGPAASHLSALAGPQATNSEGSGHRTADALSTIEILRGRIGEEFQIAERYDSKGRQLFTLAAGFFAAVQAVAFGAFGRAESVSHGARIALLAMTVVAGAGLLIVGHKLANAEAPLKESDVPPDDLIEWLESGEADEVVLLQQVGALAEVAKRRAASNAERKKRYEQLQIAARCSLILSGLDLILALAVRI